MSCSQNIFYQFWDSLLWVILDILEPLDGVHLNGLRLKVYIDAGFDESGKVTFYLLHV